MSVPDLPTHSIRKVRNRNRVWPYLIAGIVWGLIVQCSPATYPVIVSRRIEAPPQIQKVVLEDHQTLFLLLSEPTGQQEWEQTAESLRAKREKSPEDCREWNDEAVYRILLFATSTRGKAPIREAALPLLDQARRLCPSNIPVQENYRTAFVLSGAGLSR